MHTHYHVLHLQSKVLTFTSRCSTVSFSSLQTSTTLLSSTSPFLVELDDEKDDWGVNACVLRVAAAAESLTGNVSPQSFTLLREGALNRAIAFVIIDCQILARC